MSSRKDYVATAKALYEVRHSYLPNWDANLFRACDDHAKAMADVYAADNPRFDRARFLDAAGFARKWPVNPA